MCRIICFVDSSTLATTVQQMAASHDLHLLSASRLANDVRMSVQQINPDLVLLELNPTMDNAHLYFFLRSDQATRTTPIILISPSELSAHQSAIFGADAIMSRKQIASNLHQTLVRLLPQRRSIAA